MSPILRHAWAVIATLLILDVLLCGAWLLSISKDPSLAPNQLADLSPLVMGYVLVPAILLLGIAAGIARRVLKGDVQSGLSKPLDLLGRPLVAAFLGLLSVAVWIALAEGPEELRNPEAVMALGAMFAGSLAALSVAGLVVRRITVRGLTVLVVIALAGVAISLAVMDARGRSRLVAQRDAARLEVAAERQRQQSVIRPVTAAPESDANAVDTYRPLIDAQALYLKENPGLRLDELQTASSSPAAAPPSVVLAALERFRGDLDKLREATRARRAFWPLDYEQGTRLEPPSIPGARALAQLAIIDANQKAQAGDVQGAAAGYLAVLRFGTDFDSGPLTAVLTGAGIERAALEALARLTRSPRAEPVLDAIGVGLERLEPSLIDLGAGLLNERLLFAMNGPREDPAAFARELGLGGSGGLLSRISPLIPWNAYQADGVDGLNATLKEMQTLLTNRDVAVWQKLEEDFLPRYYFPNPSAVYRAAVPSIMRAHVKVVEGWVLMSALRAAVTLEKMRLADGRYPAEPAELPRDSFSSSRERLRYRVSDDGSGYFLYSVGPDHKDGGGRPEQDLVLPGGAWPSADEDGKAATRAKAKVKGKVTKAKPRN